MGLRRAALVTVMLLGTACGIDAIATGGATTDGTPSSDGSPGRDGATVLPDGAVIDSDGSIITLDSGLAVVPSHVEAVVDPSAPDLVGVVGIDTTTRIVRLTGGAPTPAGLRFVDVGGIAVLYVGTWTIDLNVDVTGNPRLIVIAAGTVIVRAKLDASANNDAAGPGGSGPASGTGAGTNANPDSTDDPGGGGAGFGTAGARGGNGNAVTGANPGGMYGALLSDFLGGSGGGLGSPYNVAPCTTTDGNGGAGGGALQITSAASITIDPNGVVAAVGGGGRGGCLNGGDSTMSGGGGGSGGTIFLEAPSVVVQGALSTNGGGGGGGAQAAPVKRGLDGADGTLSLTPAAGGIGANPERNGGTGGARGLVPSQPTGSYNNAGGGGGAHGRIWLRTRGAQANVAAATALTPAPGLDTSL